MVAHSNEFGADERDDPERFPVGPLPPSTPQPIIQLRMDPKVWEDPASKPVLKRAVAEADPSKEQPPLIPPLVELLRVLRSLGAISIAWPLDESLDLLTPDQRLRRRAIVDATFRPDVDLQKAVAMLIDLPFVLEALPLPDDAPPAEDLLGSDDQDLDKQWYVFRVRADRAWARATGLNVVIGDVDYGFLTTHHDLTNIEAGKAYNSHDGSDRVSHGARISHGTAVLGLAGAAKNNTGIRGIAYQSSLWPVQANSGAGLRIDGDKWARGIQHIWQTDSGGRRKVAILEVQTKPGGCYEMVSSTRTAVQEAIDANVIVVVAAGNGQRDVSLTDHLNTYPASESILVGATDFHTRLNPRSPSSNFGPRITVSAPGYYPADRTCDKDNNDDYRRAFGGTSGAAPKVAAACALMLQVNDSLSHADVKRILVETGTEVVTSPNKPAGVFLDVEAAVNMAATQ